MLAPRVQVADRLADHAARDPDRLAVVVAGRDGEARAVCTFAELDADASALARGLIAAGAASGTRLALMVPPGVEFVKLVFALLRSGATTILVDPGMGRRGLVDCLAAAEPDGFIGVSRAHAVRTILRRRFPRARLNVTVGRRWFWGGATYGGLLRRGRASGVELPTTRGDDPAAIIFTSGSTGPPKGVLYTQRMFDAQVDQIQQAYDIQPGGVDLACFALFGLFNSAMGVTTVFPQMDFARPAAADPQRLLAAANRWCVTQAFASPAVWDKLSRHGEQTGERIPTLRQVFSCGAPVSAEIVNRTRTCVSARGAQMHTPYGATEALPVSTIEAQEILGETAAATSKGAGVCVGRKFGAIEWRVIQITDEPIANIAEAEELPAGEIGELIVRGPQVSHSYLPVPSPGHSSRERKPDEFGAANRRAKIRDGAAVWHRMGDVGYLDDRGRFWYCGRKSHRVETASGPLFSANIEGVFDRLPGVRRSALVYVNADQHPHDQLPVMVIELNAEWKATGPQERDSLIGKWYDLEPRLETLWYAPKGYVPLRAILFHPSLPVDVRHNSKINREALATWAAMQLCADNQAPR